MKRMTIHRTAIGVGATFFALAALTGCAAAGSGGEGAEPVSDEGAVTRFVQCLEDAGEKAKIGEDGRVSVRMPDSDGSTAPNGDAEVPLQPPAGGADSGVVSMEVGPDGSYMSVDKADALPEEGGLRDAWKACEKEVPEFTQPEADLGGEGGKALTSDEIAKIGLEFAKCARGEGYADFADPDQSGMITFPAGMSEDEFRNLVKACTPKDAEFLPIDSAAAESFDFDWQAVLSDLGLGGMMIATSGVGE